MHCNINFRCVVLLLGGFSTALARRVAFPNSAPVASALSLDTSRSMTARMSAVQGKWLFSAPETTPKRILYLFDERQIALNDDGTIPIEVERRFYDLVDEVGWDEACQVMDKGNNVPKSPEALEDELTGNWGIRFSNGLIPDNGVTGSAPGEAMSVTAHFLRIAPASSNGPRLQCTESIRDTKTGKATAQTLDGEYKVGFINETKGAFRRVFPYVKETYQQSLPGRSWVCTFLGEKILIARNGPAWGVYERLNESQVQTALWKSLE